MELKRLVGGVVRVWEYSCWGGCSYGGARWSFVTAVSLVVLDGKNRRLSER